MAKKNQREGDPIAALQIDEYGHLPADTDPLVAAEWYTNSGRTAEAVRELIRHANGGQTPGEAARAGQTDEDPEGSDNG